jgi:hypothetical protein
MAAKRRRDPCADMLRAQQRAHDSQMRSRDERDRILIRAGQVVIAALLTILAGVLGVQNDWGGLFGG